MSDDQTQRLSGEEFFYDNSLEYDRTAAAVDRSRARTFKLEAGAWTSYRPEMVWPPAA